ncbi:hypothetical protein ABB37_03725 [Leptomonas pyrrhocoris]|uniref:Uncharacterized protein n=1 Tax=Leptomonas pyrrhocoris TaxID=157538 RepID=A0A0N0VFL0_LEPPY|nr:hypothetical protein ABB37_03725 [Leptomonas pyrrhocoris]XP_015659768.1 hypothetical protein ABB37_03725 [Leptomonas pyrrhocoris]XP_015659769.1 hypothetical protein ABB37_03725 [Leptomonas pyrrhocoris]KPA81328.1 hypothetical protein ABB37_03725 [Leptomonas pyrrhocoris]KPA81329.1 hypothetical protein ABB37_03725 [Leptomonas pyrrhocoris]KPA81330.1 hypothetical protein ABB37_03725 [Leptomonas pyrrhocoris]|eukprot:XP_015659767.1 hypothetical protein ABB37_03725 [Leptomonas pyrrhocoris]
MMHTDVVSCSPPPFVTGEASSARRLPPSHMPVPVDPVTSLQHLEEDVQRDVTAAQQRSRLLQEEVDSLLARIAEAQESSAAEQGDNDPVAQRVEAIRRRRQE